MQQIVINSCYGGFNISENAIQLYNECEPKTRTDSNRSRYLKRDDPILIRVIDQLGTLANGPYAELRIVEIPEGVQWLIEEYDGIEYVAEKHRTWGK